MPNGEHIRLLHAKYTIKHRHGVDLSKYTNEIYTKLDVTLPRKLLVDIELLLLNSSNECQIDVTEKIVFYVSESDGAKFRLNIGLLFKVNNKNGSAVFDLRSRHLVIILSIVQPTVKKVKKCIRL